MSGTVSLAASALLDRRRSCASQDGLSPNARGYSLIYLLDSLAECAYAYAAAPESSMIYKARKAQLSYGRPLGILTLEENIPCPPGTPGNPTTFSHPVCYEVVRGVDLLDTANPAGLASFIAAGRVLVDKGVCAIAGNCGRMIVYQEQLAAALPVPVFLSSLLQLPFIAGMYGPESTIGIVASSGTSLKPEHLRLASSNLHTKIVLTSMEGKPHFGAAVNSQNGELHFEKVQAEVVEVAQELLCSHADLKAILFECVDLPPYANAVQEALGLPVFDITTLIGHAYSALSRMPFCGIY